MKSDHDGIKEMLPEYLKGSLPEKTRNNVEAHLKDCRDCRDELSFISGLVNVDVPDPGNLFWKTLPHRVRRAVEKQRTNRFSLRALIFRPLPVAATIAVLFLLIFTYAKKEAPELNPLFKDPLTASVLDYSDITEKDIPLITEQLTGDELYPGPESSTEYSYHREFASLSSGEMDSLYEVLIKEQQAGG